MTQQTRSIDGLSPDHAHHKLLVVEDVEFSRMLLVNLLEKIGFEVQSVVNGEEAIDQFTAFQPDLIWMDIHMPVMNGKAATKRIRQLPGGDTLPIIAITASSTLDNKASLQACGFDDVVHKPFHLNDLIPCLETHLGLMFIDKQTVERETPAQLMAKLDGGQLQAIPAETRAVLSKAATEGDIDQLQQLIMAFPDDLADMKTALMLLAENFEFEVILQQL